MLLQKIEIVLVFSLFFLLQNKKSAPTEADAQKTQTPIVAKLTDVKEGDIFTFIIVGICIFIKFTIIKFAKQSVIFPERDIHPISPIQLVWPTQHSTFPEEKQAFSQKNGKTFSAFIVKPIPPARPFGYAQGDSGGILPKDLADERKTIDSSHSLRMTKFVRVPACGRGRRPYFIVIA